MANSILSTNFNAAIKNTEFLKFIKNHYTLNVIDILTFIQM